MIMMMVMVTEMTMLTKNLSKKLKPLFMVTVCIWLSTELETADSGTNQQKFNDGCPTQDTKTNQTQNIAKTRDQNLDASTMF